MKPGWKTTEFWSASIAQMLALLTVLGVITSKESETLGDALVKILGAVAALIVNGTVVVHYIRGRLLLKTLDSADGTNGTAPREDTSPKPVSTKAILLPLLLLFALAGPAQAQTLLPWRTQIDHRLKDQQALIAQLIANQRQAPPTAPPIIVNPQPLPIQGEPKQQLPIGGEPKQLLPPGGQPKQDLPILGDPRQELPGMPRLPPGAQQPVPYSVRYRALGHPVP